MDDRVLIFDTTLRDGEQSPGATLNLPEKLEIARQLARLGVDIIEAGFAIASPGDFEAVSRIAQDVGQLENGPIITSLARCNKTDIDRAWGAVQAARKPNVIPFPVWPAFLNNRPDCCSHLPGSRRVLSFPNRSRLCPSHPPPATIWRWPFAKS